MTEELLKRLDALAAKLGVAGGELWRIMLKQQTVDAWRGIAFAVIASLFGGLFIWAYGPRRSDQSDADMSCLVLGVILAAIGIITFLYNIGVLVNPEYYALQDILSLIKK